MKLPEELTGVLMVMEVVESSGEREREVMLSDPKKLMIVKVKMSNVVARASSCVDIQGST